MSVTEEDIRWIIFERNLILTFATDFSEVTSLWKNMSLFDRKFAQMHFYNSLLLS